MASLKQVKNLFVLSLVCVVIVRIKGTRMDADEDQDAATSDTRIVYDQRQSGKYNIHVVIKDVAIIEMDQNEIADQNYSDEEYYYDEGALTIKPISLKPTTPTSKPLNATTTKPTQSSSSTKITSFTTESTIYPPTHLNTDITALNNQDMTTFTSSILWNTLIPTTMSSKKRPNVVVLNTQSPTKPLDIDIKARSKIEPIYAIEEPVLKPKHHLLDYNFGMPPQAQSRVDYLPIDENVKSLGNSKIYKVKVHRSHQPHHFTPLKVQTRRCRSYQYRDSSGNCHGKRSSSSGSILKRLFSMLVTLPFVRGEQSMED